MSGTSHLATKRQNQYTDCTLATLKRLMSAEKKKPARPSNLPNFPKLEEEVLARWKKESIFQKTLEQTKNGPRFVFFEGPPTANGRPGIHHVLARVFKDVIPRYKTMRGYFVERKAGWDTHGLPVELEVEKKLGLKSKKEVEAYGIAAFNEACKASVWTYKKEWEELTERIGFWLDLEHPYITYTPDYMESVWWILKQVWEKKLLYQDYKVVPQCPRCGTALSSHEVAQGYKRVKEQSVYIKFKIKNEKGKIRKGDYILSWTTTPWTLPGNVALAVGADIDYVITKDQKTGERFIQAKSRLFSGPLMPTEMEGVATMKGSELVGIEYEPLFDFLDLEKLSGKKAYYVADADFVSTEDGTGVVHTAVMYGEDDYRLGEKIGLPKYHTVTESGLFTDDVKPWAGWFVKDDKTQAAILDYLKEHNELYKTEEYEHDYPFCWRCDSPLLYYAKTSWFIKMSALRDKLIQNNKQINWIPSHIKEGRFGEWLREVKDWAISRERYWGTPLPIWECEVCEEKLVIGGMDELKKHARKRNTYFLMRHGKSENHNAGVLSSWPEKKAWSLTEEGRQKIKDALVSLKKKKITTIIASDVQRTKETAEMVGEELNIPVSFDARLREIDCAAFNGRSVADFRAAFQDDDRLRWEKGPGGSESLLAVRRRMLSVLRDLEEQHAGANILLVGHGDPIWMLESAFPDSSYEAAEQIATTNYPEPASVHVLKSPGLPFGDDGAIDLHRPFIDAVLLQCPSCKGTMRRVKELCDVWFDSGSMPFAQWHYPFQEKNRIEKGISYPADYISEAVDQTRGWFYTLLAISTLLEKGAPFKNVICLAHILDAKGQKMSKHIGNVVNPWDVINEYGADALRMLFFTMNQPGETKLFDTKAVGEVVRKQLMMLWNVLSFWKLSGGAGKSGTAPSAHILDRWILAVLQQLVARVTDGLDRYDITTAGRQLGVFMNDLSTWYVRRSRSRFRADGPDKAAASATLTHVLQTLARLLAPFTPHLADALYQETGGGRASVHLEAWPGATTHDENVIHDMELTRSVVEMVHALREASGIRVRQPLGQLVVRGAVFAPEYARVLQDELNVKEVLTVADLPTGTEWKRSTDGPIGVALDITVTDELLYEGWMREVVRHANDLRKKARLTIADRITLYYTAKDEKARFVFQHYADTIRLGSRAGAVTEGTPPSPRATAEFELGGARVTLAI